MKKIISLLFIFVLIVSTYLFYSYSTTSLSANDQIVEMTIADRDQEKIPKTKILAVGDSLTAGYGLNISESYPSQLEKKLLEAGKNVEVINMGVSGETTAGLLERVEFIKKQKPKIIFITIGGNDALRALPLGETENNIIKIIQSLKEVVDADHIFIANIQAPANLGKSYTDTFNNFFSSIAQAEQINLLKFVVQEVFTNGELMQGDGVHPNKMGYQVLVEKYIYPEVIKKI